MYLLRPFSFLGRFLIITISYVDGKVFLAMGLSFRISKILIYWSRPSQSFGHDLSLLFISHSMPYSSVLINKCSSLLDRVMFRSEWALRLKCLNDTSVISSDWFIVQFLQCRVSTSATQCQCTCRYQIGWQRHCHVFFPHLFLRERQRCPYKTSTRWNLTASLTFPLFPILLCSILKSHFTVISVSFTSYRHLSASI